MHGTPLPLRLREPFAHRRPQARMLVRNDQLHPRQAPLDELLEEVRPTRLRFFRPEGHP